jgi:hypothetical protein
VLAALSPKILPRPFVTRLLLPADASTKAVAADRDRHVAMVDEFRRDRSL